jgi:hypothetical protein
MKVRLIAVDALPVSPLVLEALPQDSEAHVCTLRMVRLSIGS